MKKQTGFIALAILGVILFLGISVFLMYVNAANTANSFEQNLVASQKSSEVSLAQYGQTVVEASQVPDMARDDIVEIAKSAIKNRYGEDGSKAVFQAIQEQNPSVDPKLYINIQQIIESGRNKFETSQNRIIEVKRAYTTELGTVFTGTLMRMAGYPKLDLDKFDIVSTSRASKAFETGKEDSPIQLRPSK